MIFCHYFINSFLPLSHFIIKLMQKQFRMERQVPYLSQQDFKKLFPQQYFTKYAEHLNILKFEQTIFKEPITKREKQFTDRSKRTASQGNLRQVGKVKLNKYDPVGDTIAKNKVETVRMQKFVRVLDQKLKAGPSKTAMTIRTPLQGYNEVPSEVLDKMRFIQNEQYSREMQILREKRKAQDEFVRFTMRNRSISPSKLSMMSRSIVADSVESRSVAEKEQFTINLSNTMQLHHVDIPTSKQSSLNIPQGSQSLTYNQRLTKLMAQARSEVTQLNPESRNADVKYIMAMNRSIRKINTLKDEIRSERRRRTVAEWKAQAVLKAHVQLQREEKKRKNLIAMTEEIRKEGERIELLSRFQELVRERQFKEFLMVKENGAVAAAKQGNT